MIAVTFVRIPDKSYRDHDTVALRRMAGQFSAAGPGTPRQPARRATGTTVSDLTARSAARDSQEIIAASPPVEVGTMDRGALGLSQQGPSPGNFIFVLQGVVSVACNVQFYSTPECKDVHARRRLTYPGGQTVCVTLVRPRGLSGSMPSFLANASASNCPGTISPIGASHSGRRGPGKARLQASASASPPPTP